MIKVRPANHRDAAFIADVYSPFGEESWTSFETHAPGAEDVAQRITDAGTLYPWLIAENESGPLAYAYASPHRSRQAYITSVDTTVYCAAAARGRGVGRALYSKLLEVLIKQNYVSAFAGIALPNDASIALHRRVGFSLIGTYPNVGYKHGQWRDTQWWHCPLVTCVEPPAPILPYTGFI